MSPRLTNLLILCLSICTAQGQTLLPSTDVYLFEMHIQNDSTIHVFNPQFVNSYHTDGYNNQVHFLDDHRMLISSNVDDANQTDLYILNFRDMTKMRLTMTSGSEFSAKRSRESEMISCIRLENDSAQSQLLWEYPLDRSHFGQAINDENGRIGYYEWINNNELVCFVTGEPHKLGILDLSTQQFSYFASQIGRQFEILEQYNILYLHKLTPSNWYLKVYDRLARRSEMYCRLPFQTEDFLMLDQHRVVMADGSLLKLYNKHEDRWFIIQDLSVFGIKKATRLVKRGKKLIVVALKDG